MHVPKRSLFGLFINVNAGCKAFKSVKGCLITIIQVHEGQVKTRKYNYTFCQTIPKIPRLFNSIRIVSIIMSVKDRLKDISAAKKYLPYLPEFPF